MNHPTSFTISRKKWLRGHNQSSDEASSALCTFRGKQCCLGHWLTACGVELVNDCGFSCPSDLQKELPLVCTHSNEFGWKDSDFATNAMRANDQLEYVEADREDKIKHLFAEQGVTLTFID